MSPTHHPGPALVAIALGDPADAWERAGFTVTAGRVGVGALTLQLGATGPTPRLRFDRPHPQSATELDGIVWEIAAPTSPSSRPSLHPNGVDGVDHVVITSPDLERVRRTLVAAGFEIRRERPTSIAGRAVTQLFAWAGDVLLEIVAPDAGGDPAAAEPSALWGIAVTSTDIDATSAFLGDFCTTPTTAVQAGRRIATVRTTALGIGPTLAVMSGTAGEQQEKTLG